MKKLILAVAVLAASISASAQTWNFTTAPSSFSGNGEAVFTDGAVATLSASTTLLTPSTFGSYSGLGFVYKNSGGATKVGFKFDAAGGFVQADGGDVTIIVTGCTAGQTVGIIFSAKGGTAVTASELITGKPTTSLDAAYPNNMTLQGAEVTAPAIVTGEAAVKVAANYTVTNAGTIAFKAKSGFRIYTISKGTALSTSDAISSDLLSKQGDVLVNNVGEVKIVSALGATVLSSSDASINISGLPSGVYVAVTEQGTLKFVK